MNERVVPIGKVARVQSGYAFKSDQFTNSGIRLLRNANILPGRIYWDDLACIDKKRLEEFESYQLIVGDVLLSLDRPIISSGIKVARIAESDIPALLVQRVGRFILDESSIDAEYLYAFLQSPKFIFSVSGHEQSLGVPHISPAQIESIEIPLPRIEKQRQIAARLKAQLAEVDKARQAAEAQLRDAQLLYAAILDKNFSSDSCKTWPKIDLGEAGDVAAGITLGRKTNGKTTRPIPYLRVANVKDGYLDLSDVSTIDATEAEVERLLLKPGDILLTEGGDPDKLGRGTFWNDELKECIHQNHIFRVRFPKTSYIPEFIAAQISSKYGKDYFFTNAKKTTGIATINQKVLKSFPVLSPTIEIQQSVMNKIKNQLDEAGRIIQLAAEQFVEINLLPQKILAQAFGDARP